MDKEMKLPKRLMDQLVNEKYELDNIGCSDSSIIIFSDKVLKIEKQSEESDNEHRMYQWLQGKLPIPMVYESFCEQGYNYLLMSRLEGEMVCSEHNLSSPDKVIRYLVNGLKILWNIPIIECPVVNSLDNKLRLAKERIDKNLIDMNEFEPETFGEDGFSSIEELYDYLVKNKPMEEYTLIHGDYCLPNIFVVDDKISGYIDLGRSGIGDKWQDIALCVRSLKHNFHSDAYCSQFFEELGIEYDEEKVKYYILLDELF